MPRWPLITLLLAPGCIVVVGPGEDPPDTDPIRSECDADQDGVLAVSCGGTDCDDLDATVRPGAHEWFDDGIDQDCDGTTDVKIDRFPLPDRTRALSWDWRPDLRGLGGLIVQPTGKAVAQELDLDPSFGGPVVLKRRSTYHTPVGDLTAARLSDQQGVLDLLSDEQGLAAWRPDGSEGTRLWTRPDLVLSSLAASRVHDDSDAAWLLSCDGDEAVLRTLDLRDGSTLSEVRQPSDATSCALLGQREQSPVVMLSDGATLERWVVDGEAFTDRLVLARGLSGNAVRTVGNGNDGALAFVDEGVLTVLDRDGRGLRLAEGTATDVFDVALSDGEVVISWVDTQGSVWIGAGPIEGPVLPVSVVGEIAQASPLAVGALDDELAVAVQDPDGLLLLRARR